MGSFNFSIQDSLTVGVTETYYTEDEIDEETAREWLAEQKAESDEFVYKLNKWLDSVIDLGFEFTTDSLYRAEVELGYHSGFQIYVEDLDGKHGEHLLDHLEEWDNLPMDRGQAEQLIEKVYATAQFILIDYAKNAGLGITAGGWTGGSAQYHKIQTVWETYKQDADAELLAQWEEMSK